VDPYNRARGNDAVFFKSCGFHIIEQGYDDDADDYDDDDDDADDYDDVESDESD
jgi:hypothetical protein